MVSLSNREGGTRDAPPKLLSDFSHGMRTP